MMNRRGEWRSGLSAVRGLGVYLGILVLTTHCVEAGVIATSSLIGDPRLDRPDSIAATLSVSLNDLNPSLTTWTVDVTSAVHPDAELKRLYFNLELPAGASVKLANSSPGDWRLSRNETAHDSADTRFQFEIWRGGDVTVGQPLQFDLVMSNGVFTPEVFGQAAYSTSKDPVFAPMQVGAHFHDLEKYSMGTAGLLSVLDARTAYSERSEGCGDSQHKGRLRMGDRGFAEGEFQAVPEPGTLALALSALMSGLVLAGLRRRVS